MVSKDLGRASRLLFCCISDVLTGASAIWEEQDVVVVLFARLSSSKTKAFQHTVSETQKLNRNVNNTVQN